MVEDRSFGAMRVSENHENYGSGQTWLRGVGHEGSKQKVC